MPTKSIEPAIANRLVMACIVPEAPDLLPVGKFSAGFGPLEQLEQAINNLKEIARKADKDPSEISIYMISYPTILESSLSSNQARTPMTGTIEQIGSDIEHIKAMGTSHIIFGHQFSSVGRDMKNMIEVTKELARYAK